MNIIYLKNNKVDEKSKCNNPFCNNNITKRKKECIDFLESNYDNEALICPYGFTAVFRQAYVCCGFVATNNCDKKHIKWIIKTSKYAKNLSYEKINAKEMTGLVNFLTLYDHQTINSHTKHELTNFIGQLKTLLENYRSNNYEENFVVEKIKYYVSIYNKFDVKNNGYSNVIRKIFNNNDLIVNLKDSKILDQLRGLVDLYDGFIDEIGDTSNQISLYLSRQNINFKSSNNHNYKSIVYMHELFSYRIKYHKTLLNEEQEIAKHIKYNWYTMTEKHCSMMEYVADKKNIFFDIKKPRGRVENEFYGDENVYLALYILLENAVKFSPYGKDILVNIYDDNITSTIEIINQSSFISEESLMHIFDRGFYGDNASSSNSTGLGLFLVKTIMDENKISVDVTYNDGYYKVVLSAKCAEIIKL